MRTALRLDVTFEQVLALVRQLPAKEKLELSRALEKEGIESRLSSLLDTFKTNELPLDTITEEVEIIRQQLYESRKQ